MAWVQGAVNGTYVNLDVVAYMRPHLVSGSYLIETPAGDLAGTYPDFATCVAAIQDLTNGTTISVLL